MCVCVCVCVDGHVSFRYRNKRAFLASVWCFFFLFFLSLTCGMKIKFETTKKIFHSAATAAAGNSLRFPIRLMENVRHGNRS